MTTNSYINKLIANDSAREDLVHVLKLAANELENPYSSPGVGEFERASIAVLLSAAAEGLSGVR